MKDIDGYVTKDDLYRLISRIKHDPDIVVDDRTCAIIAEAISDMPSLDKPVKYGVWLNEHYLIGFDLWEARCSQCHYLVESPEVISENYNLCPHCGANMRGEERAADVQSVNRWVSVDDRLPNIDERVLVYIPRPDNHSNIEIAYISEGNDDYPYWVLRDKSQFYSTRFHYISHWMPLPKLPKRCEKVNKCYFCGKECGEILLTVKDKTLNQSELFGANMCVECSEAVHSALILLRTIKNGR